MQPETSTWSVINLKKTHKTSMSSQPKPAIWPNDNGQWITCFDRCQLAITWMSNIKDVRCKPRLYDLVLAGLWPPCCKMSLPLGACAHDLSR